MQAQETTPLASCCDAGCVIHVQASQAQAGQVTSQGLQGLAALSPNPSALQP